MTNLYLQLLPLYKGPYQSWRHGLYTWHIMTGVWNVIFFLFFKKGTVCAAVYWNVCTRSEERILGKFCVHMWNFPSERSNGSMWAECRAVLSSFLFGAHLALPCYILSATLLSTCICIHSLPKWAPWQGHLVVTEGNGGQSSGLGLLWTWPAWCGLWTSIRCRLYLDCWILNLQRQVVSYLYSGLESEPRMMQCTGKEQHKLSWFWWKLSK